MPYTRNTETQDALVREVKALQSSCVDACNIIENAPADTQFITPDNVVDKALHYVEGVRTEIDNSKTSVVADDNLLTSQFLCQMKERLTKVEKLQALNRGNIHDLDNEITRLESLINISKEARSKPKVRKQEVGPEHIQKAKERFQNMKSELHGLIESLFPNNSQQITDVLGQLMQQRLDETSNGYIAIAAENYQVIELLKDANLVIANPYNNMEVKLAYEV